jgi:hypothetical protein
MKKLSVLFIFLVSLNVSAYFTVNANCFVQQGRTAVCEVCNYQYRTFFCQMRINGQTRSGAWLNGFQNLMLYPGQCASGYVHAINPFMDPLFFANAQATCN